MNPSLPLPHALAWVWLGGAAGTGLRYAVASWGGSPWDVAGVNLLGSLLLGFLVGVAAPRRVRLFLGTGLCGGLTTFSGFVAVVDTSPGPASLFITLNLLGGLACALVGITCGTWSRRRHERREAGRG